MVTVLRLKHWQLFLLLYGIYFAMAVYQFLIDISSFGSNEVSSFIKTIWMFSIVSLISFAVGAWWEWMLATGLRKKLPDEKTFNIQPFMVLFFLEVGYNALTQFGFVLGELIDARSIHKFLGPVVNITILDIRATTIISTLISIYFAYIFSKLLTMVETRRDVSFGDHAGTFLLIIFFPIGVWFVQPRINKVFRDYSEVPDIETPLDHNINNR